MGVIRSKPPSWLPLLIRLLALATTAIGCAAQPAMAQAGLVGTPIATCIAPMRPAVSAASILTRPRGFDCHRPQSSFGSGDFDVIATSVPTLAGQHEVAIRFASVWQDRTDLYLRYADGMIGHVALDETAITRHLQLGAVVEYRPPHRHVPITGLLWRTRGAGNMRAVVLAPTIADPKASAESNLVLGAIYAAFGGLCLALLTYNIALWRALRYRFQLVYCIMVATLALYAFSSSGAMAWAFPTIANADRIRVNYLTLAIAMVAALAFARSFFEERVFAGWLRPLTSAVMAIVVSAAVAFVLFGQAAPLVFDRLYCATFLLVLAAVFPIMVRAWRRRSNYLWLFALGWAAPIFFAAMRLSNSLHLIPYGFWVDNSTILAMTLEALLSSLAVAYRIHLVGVERDDAREQEIAARMLAAIDPLTGLLNRRAFLEKGIGRPGDQQLLLVDIDYFKRVNDTIGHDGGDEVLRLFARALRAAVPAEALIARMGGEEFAILAPVDSTLSAMSLLDTVRNERMPFDLSVTASIGAATGPLTSEVDWKRLYRRADMALFEAKAAGRDRARDAPVGMAA